MRNRRVSNENFVELDGRLDVLFRQYHDALPDADSGRDFMPDLWKRIDARQAQTHFFGRMSRVLVTAGLAASVLLGMLLSVSGYQASSYFNANYIEALAAQQGADVDGMVSDRALEMEQQ